MKKVDARDCKLIKVDKDEEKRFLNENHVQGYISSEIAYGLTFNDELIQIMTFGGSNSISYQWELFRNCSSIEVNLGTEMLWKHFTETHDPRSCVLNIPIGENETIYGNCLPKDFKFIGVTEDFYYYEYSYFPFGVLYRIEDIDTGVFYIGETTDEHAWDNGYMGSGTTWLRYYNKYKNSHKFSRTIISNNFDSPSELYFAEREAIRKHAKCVDEKEDIWKVTNPLCKNIKTGLQPGYKRCRECGGFGTHKKSCSRYVEKICPECGGLDGKHCKGCQEYKERQICPECGVRSGHLKSCSHFTTPEPCPECGALYRHYEGCSLAKEKIICEECGGTDGKHKSTCSKRKIVVCDECGGKGGRHYKSCSKYKPRPACPECGSITAHKKTCSRSKHKVCPECGSLTAHKSWCSHSNKNVIVCEECGGLRGTHKKGCSQYKEREACPECGSPRGHLKSCSKYIAPANVCPECGKIGRARHKPGCSKYKPIEKCKECGGQDGHHKKSCSKYKFTNK